MVTTPSITATQSLVTALGGGSGIDMLALANNLAAAQFASKTDRLTTRSETLSAQVSSASNIRSMLLALDTSLGERVRVGDLSPAPTVANAAVASASLSGTRQPSGSYSLEVTALAKAQTLASAPFAAASSTVGSGTLTLRFGTIAGGTFTPDGTRAVDFTIAPGATLADVANQITAAGRGVTAYVAQTTSGAQLVLKGSDGATNGFVVETTADPDLSLLAWTPASLTGTLLATAGDAAFKVDGLPMTAPSNKVTDAIPGVTLQLTATNAGAPTTVGITNPASAISDAMTDLVGALNELAGELKTATDPQTGDLKADAGARALRRALSQLAGSTVMPNATGVARTLADLGVSTQRDGTFALDSKRLSATLAADPQGVAAMFTTGLYGVYATMNKLYRSATTTSDVNSLGASISRYTKAQGKLAADKADLAEQQEKLRASLAARFTTSETRIGQSKATLAMIQNQIAQWNKSTG